MKLSRRSFVSTAIIGAATLISVCAIPMARAGTRVLEVFKSPSCGCCSAWVEHMRNFGFDVRVKEVEDLSPIKARLGVAADLQSCHTAIVNGYVIEGHVPAGDVTRLLAERPNAIGLAVPGMPIGSPGMEQGGRQEAYQVILFSRSDRSVFARY